MDYNTFIQNLVAAGHDDIQDHSEGFRVVGCTADVDARDNTGTNTNTDGAGVPIYWLNGNKVADDNADFYDGSWDDEANDKDESGNNGPDTSISDYRPMTGCNHGGREWFASGIGSRGLGASNVRVGRPNDSGAGNGPLSSSFNAEASSESRPMYGLSQVFTVAGEPGQVLVSEKLLSLTEGNGGYYNVSLNRQPAANVTVTIGGHAGTNVTPSPTSLTFTTTNWRQPQSVSVSTTADANRTNESVTLTHTATSSDSSFNNITGPGVIVNVDDQDALPAHPIRTIRPPQGSHALPPGDKVLPEEEFEVETGRSAGRIEGVAVGHRWRPSGIWGDPDADTVWVVDPSHFGIHALKLSALKQGRIERHVAADTTEIDYRLNYRCHFNESRASGYGNPSLTVMWGRSNRLWIANESSGTIDAYDRDGSVTAGCYTANVTSWAADGQSYTTANENFKSPFEFLTGIDVSRGPRTVRGIWASGTHAWLSGPTNGAHATDVYTFPLGSSSQMAIAPGYEGHGASYGLWSDGTTMWVATWSGWLRAYHLNSGIRSAEFDIRIQTYGMPPDDMWSDGETIWVTNRTGKIDAYHLPGPMPAAGPGRRERRRRSRSRRASPWRRRRMTGRTGSNCGSPSATLWK